MRQSRRWAARFSGGPAAAFQGPRGDDAAAAVGHDHGPREANVEAGDGGRRGRSGSVRPSAACHNTRCFTRFYFVQRLCSGLATALLMALIVYLPVVQGGGVFTARLISCALPSSYPCPTSLGTAKQARDKQTRVHAHLLYTRDVG